MLPRCSAVNNMNKIKLKSPAKINLFLEITGKRKDGYHNLITIFAKTNVFEISLIYRYHESENNIDLLR